MKSEEVMKEKAETKRGPGRPRKKEEGKDMICGDIMRFMDWEDRGSKRPKVVHSPPKKWNAEKWAGVNESKQGEVEKIGKEEKEKREKNKNEMEDKEGRSEEESTSQDKGEREKGKKEKKRDKEEEENNEEQEEKEEENKDKGENNERKKNQEGREEEGENEKARPKMSDIEKMLMKERIKVLENEVNKMKESDMQKRIETLEETVRKMRREKEEEKEKWREEKKELIEKVRRYEKEIEENIREENREKEREKEKKKKRSEEKESEREVESRGEIEQRKSYSRIVREKNKSKEREKENTHKKREGAGREERENKDENRGKPQGVTEEFMKYEMRERRERRRGMIITRNDREDGREQEEDMIKEVCKRLKIEEKKIRVKYEGEKKANIEFKQMEDKMEALRNKRKLMGTNIWIGDDHTKREISIQKWLRETARRERMKGKNAKVGYQKIIIENRVWKFNERNGQLEEVKFRGNAEGTRDRQQRGTSGRRND